MHARRIAAISSALVSLVVLVANTAFAGIGGSFVPTDPAGTLHVGQAFSASLTLTNTSDGSSISETINVVGGILLTPSCAAKSGINCTGPDPGVFALSSPIGAPGTSCANVTFTLGPPDPGTGEVQFIPGSTLKLGPADGSGGASNPPFCRIVFNAVVLKLPQDSDAQAPGVQTFQLADALLQSTTNLALTAPATGVSQTRILPNVDLFITKTDGVLTVNAGGSTTYTVTVTNNGPNSVTGATLIDPSTLPNLIKTAVACASNPGKCVSAPSIGQLESGFPLPLLNSGDSYAITVTATVLGSATGQVTNTATVTPPSGTFSPGTGCTVISPPSKNPRSFNAATGACTASDIDDIALVTDLLISKTDGKTTAIPGTSDTYTIVVTNFGPSVATGATVGDTFPAIFTGVTYTASATGSATGFTASGSGNIADTVTMPVGSTITYIVSGTISATATGTLTNSATVALASNIGTHCTAASPGTAANPVAFTVATGTCTATDIDQLSPQTDLLISKTDGKTTAVPGTSDTYTIVVTNFGPSVAVNAAVGDTFPAIFTGVTYTASATGSASGFTASGSGNIADTVTMPVGSTITYIVTGTISATATGTLTNSATVALASNIGTHCTAASPGPAANPVAFTAASGTCTATDIDQLSPVTDLLISKTDGKTTAVPGTSDTYTIVVTNFGPSVAVNAAVGDTFPAIFTGVTYTASATGSATGFTASGSGNIADTVTMPVGSTITYIVSGTISANATGTLSNSATVSLSNNVGTHCTAASPGTAANPVAFTVATGTCTATDIDTLGPQTDLLISKTDGKTTAIPGTSDTYTIVVTNFGPSVAVGAAVGDTFPAIFTGVTYTASATGSATGFTASGSGNIADTVTMPVGSTITYIVSGTISASATGTLSNSATVALSNNTGTHCTAASPGPAANPVSFTAASGTCTATDIDQLSPQTDLLISKTDGKTTAVPGTSDTYTIVVTNFGPSVAVNAAVGDTFPAIFTGVTYTASATGSASGFTASGSGNIADTVTMPVGSTITYIVTGTISATATGTLTNSATVALVSNIGTHCAAASPGTAANPVSYTAASGTCTATDIDQLSPQTDLLISKTDGKTTAIPGTSDTYTIVVTNFGPSVATGATVGDTFPAIFTGATFTASATGSASGFTASGSGNIADTVTMPVGSTITYVVSGTISATATGTLTNSATVALASNIGTHCTAASPGTAANPVSYTAASGTCTATDIDQLSPQTDLLISKTDGKTTAIPGTSDTYTIVVTNFGPSVAVGAAVDDTFPAIFTGVTYTASATGSASGFTASGSGNIADTVTMPVGSTITYIVSGTISATATGTLTNSATVALASNIGTHCTAASPGTAANPVSYTAASGTCTATDIDQLSPQTDLLISKTDGKTTAIPGTSDTYTIVVTNFGPSVAVNAAVGDTFPAIFTGVTYTASATGSATGFTASGSGNINDAVTMPVGSTITYIVSGTISANATGTLTNSATVSLSNNVGTHCTAASPGTAANPVAFSQVTGTCTATDIDQLSPQTDLLISKTDGKTTAIPGTSDTYTIVVTNFGPSVAVGAAVGDTFPAIFTGATYTASATGSATGFTASGSGNIGDTVTMPVGSTITYVVTGTISASATGTLTNSATVALATNSGTHCTAASPGTLDNPVSFTAASGTCTATDIDTLGPQTDLLISKTDGKTTAIPGTSDTYTIVVTNFGPSVAVNAAVGDTFPAIFTGVTYTASATGSASGFTASGSGNIADTVTMPVGSTITYIVSGTISATATGTLSNSATVALTSNIGTHCTAASPGSAANPVSYTGASGTCTATDIDQLSPQTDLLISKTDGKTTAIPGTSDTYTIVVTNFGPSVAVNAAVGDTFPAIFTGVTYTASATGSATGFTASGSGNIADTVTMPVGSTITYIVSGTISATATGTLTNSATVALTSNIGTHCTAASPGPAANPVAFTTASGTCTATDIDQLAPVTDLLISKTDGKTTAIPGTSDTYTIVVTNFGPSVAVNAAVGDTFPAIFTGVTYTASATGSASGFTASGSGNIGDTVTMPVGSTITYIVTGTISAAATGMLTNSATVALSNNVGTHCTAASPGPAANPVAFTVATGTCTATDIDQLAPVTDLLISKTDGKTTVLPGTSDTYTIVVTNFGPSVAVNAAVGDTFPAIFTGATYTASATGSATGFTASGSGNIADTVTMPVGSTITYIVTGTISGSATGTLSNSATVALSNNVGTHCTAASPGTVDNPVNYSAGTGTCTATDVDSVVPTADLLISKTDGKTTLTSGDSTSYTVVVSNFGPSDVTNAPVTDPAPTGISLGAWTCTVVTPGTGSVTTACNPASGTGPLSTSTVTLRNGGVVRYVIAATITSAGGKVTNTANVTPPNGTINPGTHCTAASPGTTDNPVSFSAGTGTCTAKDVDSVTPLACFLGDPTTTVHNGHAGPTAYPYTEPTTPLTSTTFAESTVLKKSEPAIAFDGDTIRLWYSDEHALALGIRNSSGAGALNPGAYTVTKCVPTFPYANNTPCSATGSPAGTLALSAGIDKNGVLVKPYFSGGVPAGTELGVLQTGIRTCPDGCDPAKRPVAPALYCTDITNANNNHGDWQIIGGGGTAPDYVTGTWKSATTVVNAAGVPTTTVDNDPDNNITKTKNPVTWAAGPDAEAPGGSYETLANSSLEGYGAEVRWNTGRGSPGDANYVPTNISCVDAVTGVVTSGLQSGHVYRVQFLIHDGDQNGSGGDAGQACAVIAR